MIFSATKEHTANWITKYKIGNYFGSTSNEKAWHEILVEAITSKVAIENNIKVVLSEWVHNNDKKFEIDEGIIRIVEQSDLVKKFTILNENFTKRLKVENIEEEPTNVNDKRLKNNKTSKALEGRK